MTTERTVVYLKSDAGCPLVMNLQRVVLTDTSLDGVRPSPLDLRTSVQVGWYVRWKTAEEWNPNYPVEQGEDVFAYVASSGGVLVRVELIHPLEMLTLALANMAKALMPGVALAGMQGSMEQAMKMTGILMLAGTAMKYVNNLGGGAAGVSLHPQMADAVVESLKKYVDESREKREEAVRTRGSGSPELN